jgi:hypothetical protein
MTNDTSRDPPTHSGIDFVFQAGEKKIEEQLSSAESLDVKMGVLIGFLGAIVTGLLAALLASDPAKVRPLLSNVILDTLICALLALFAADFYFAFQSFRMRKFYSGVPFQDLVRWANEDVSETKKAFIPTLIKAVALNERELADKRRNAVRAVWFVFITLLALLLTVAVIGAKFLKF